MRYELSVDFWQKTEDMRYLESNNILCPNNSPTSRLTRVICQIFEITDSEKHEAIILELEWLDDGALIEKQKYIENYIQDSTDISRKWIQWFRIIKNQAREMDEKEDINFRFTF